MKIRIRMHFALTSTSMYKVNIVGGVYFNVGGV